MLLYFGGRRISTNRIFPSSSFIPYKAFVRGELTCMCYIRNCSTFKAFSETPEKFWKPLRPCGYPLGFLLPLFREVKYSNRTKWLSRKRKSRNSRMAVFKSTFNCSHANIKRVIQRHSSDLDCIVSYTCTATLAHLCN